MAGKNRTDLEAGRIPMLRAGNSCRFWAVAVALAVIGTPGFSSAANQVGKFTVVAGSVDALREQQDAPIAAEIGMNTYMQDVVRTKHRSRTQLKFVDDSVLNMGSDYMVKIKEYVYDEDNGIRRAILSSLRGTMRATVSKFGGDSTFEVETPTAVASVRGTDFIVKVNSSMETEIIVLEGAVQVRNIDPLIRGQVIVRAGQKTRVSKAKAPSFPSYVPAQMQETLIAQTTSVATGNGISAKGLLPGKVAVLAPADTAPIAPPPPPPATFLTQRIQPVIGAQAAGGAAAPVQPPVTTTVPALITTPVSITLIF